jgi:hypothetical protein
LFLFYEQQYVALIYAFFAVDDVFQPLHWAKKHKVQKKLKIYEVDIALACLN